MYHVIEATTRLQHGPFETLYAARVYAMDRLEGFEIYNDDGFLLDFETPPRPYHERRVA